GERGEKKERKKKKKKKKRSGCFRGGWKGGAGRRTHGNRAAAPRHNVGYAVIDALAAGPGVSGFQNRFDSQVAEFHDDAEKVLLQKPETFMNLSGRAVRQAADFYQVPLEDLLVVCDDFNLPLGKLRFRAKGTHGGHNGL